MVIKKLLRFIGAITALVLLSGNVQAQHFEAVAITGSVSGEFTDTALFTATSPTLPALAFVRATRAAGPATGYFVFVNDNIGYWSSSDDTATIKFEFLNPSLNPISTADLRFVVNDLDGPDNEVLATACGNNLNFIATADPTNLTIDTTPPLLTSSGTAGEFDGVTSRAMYEFNDVSSVSFDVSSVSAGWFKAFDLNGNDFAIGTPLYSVCLDDSDGDLITDDLDMDDDNDGILDVDELQGNNPNGDNDGDGLPNYLDVSDDTGASPTYIANADGSTTDYTDADTDGTPDVYQASGDLDIVPNHLDLDSDGDGCFDAFEAGFTDANTDGRVDGSGFNGDGTVSGGDGYGTPADVSPVDGIADYLQAAFTIPNAGADQSLVVRNTTLAGNSPDSGSGTWTLVSGLGTITTPASPTSTVTDLGQGVNVFQWAFTNPACGGDAVDQVSISVNVTDNDGDMQPDILDLDDDNDMVSDTMELCGTSPVPFTGNIEVDIDLDEFEGETTWSLMDDTQAVLLSGGPYSGGDDLISGSVAVTRYGTYIFNIADAFGDGISSNGGSDENGTSGFTVKFAGNTVFESAASPNFLSGTLVRIQVHPYSCLTSDPAADEDGDGIINYQDPDYAAANGSSLNSAGVVTSFDLNSDGVIDIFDGAGLRDQVTSVDVPADDTYAPGDSLDFTVNFSDEIIVDITGGTPELDIMVGANARKAVYQSGSGSQQLLFRYVAQVGDLDTDGIVVSSLSDGGGTLQGVRGTAILTLNNVAATTGVLVDGVAPTGYSATIDQSVINSLNRSAISFTFAGAEVGTNYAYSFSSSNGAATVTGMGSITTAGQQVSGIDLSGLLDGTITLSVTLADAIGNTGTAATDSKLQDTLALSGYSVLWDDTLVNATEAATTSFTASGLEIGATINAAVTSSGDGNTASVSITPTLVTSASQQITVNVSSLSNGVLMVQLTLTDTSLNVGGVAASSSATLDKAAPTLVSTSPTDNSVDVDKASNLILTFDQNILFGSGSIQLIDLDDGSGNITINAAAAGGSASVSGAMLTISNPVGSLEETTNYAVQIANTAIVDAAGNAFLGISDSTTFNFTTADQTMPRVMSIVRQSPTVSPTNADSLVWDVSFDEAVINVDASDFVVSGTTASVGAVTNPSGNTYRVSVSGGDLAGVTTSVVLSFSAGQNISDASSNALTNTVPTGSNDDTFVLDNTAPVEPVVTAPLSALVTNQASQSITGTHPEEGAVIKLFADADNDGVADSATELNSVPVVGGNWAVAVTLLAGENNYVVQAEDSLGNTSIVVDVPTITLDTVPPTVVRSNGAAGNGIDLLNGELNTIVSEAMLFAMDNVSDADQIVYTVQTAPINGTLRRNRLALVAGMSFTQADLNANSISYDHNGSDTTLDVFEYLVSDQAGNESRAAGNTNFRFDFVISDFGLGDEDGDTVLNNQDNCVFVANTDQADLDFDGQGNVCDDDADGDGMPNSYEIANGLDPFNSFDQIADSDGDGFTNLEEFRFGSDPQSADTDDNNNGVPDSVDRRRAASPIPTIIQLLLLEE